MPHYCGVDAGGSKTECVLASGEGEVVARTIGGPGALRQDERFADAVANLVRLTCAQGGVDLAEMNSLIVGLAGVDTPAARARARTSLERILPDTEIIVGNDGEIALEAAVFERPAGVLIAGTGSIAYGEDKQRKPHRVGGWGHIFGDEGSGYVIAVEALQAVLRFRDGRASPTLLTELVVDHFGLSGPEEIVELSETVAREPDRAAAFVPKVFEAFRAGDQVAGTIIERGSEQLAELATTLLSHLDCSSCPLAFAGSVLLNEDDYARRVAERISAAAPEATIVRSSLPPVCGAVLTAIRLRSGERAAQAARTRLEASLATTDKAITLSEGAQ